LIRVEGFDAVLQIVKVPQQPSGMAYIESIITPFRDCSYVIKMQCREVGITGVREAVLLDRMIAAGMVDIEKLVQGDWPDLGFDDEEYDVEFPQHPLSRVRRGMRSIRESLKIDSELKALPPFALPVSS
jgi:hypothetical protein